MTVVDIFVSDSAPSPAFVPGVVVTLLNPTTSAIVAQVTSDSDGRAGFTVPDATYEIRLFKSGYHSSVSSIQVQASAPTNTFDVTIENVSALPSATDPRLCRCTGKFVDFSNRGTKGVTFRVMANPESGFQVPKVIDGSLVFEQTMAFKTDDRGMLSIDLLRGGEYSVTFAGEDDVVWNIKVPDVSSVNLIDLIHPYPVSLVWDHTDAPSDAITVAVGETKTVRSTLTFSDYETTTEEQLTWISFTNSDGNLMDLGFTSQGLLVLRGLSAGSVQVTAAVLPDKLPSRFPLPSLTMNPLQVTVVP